MSKRPYNIYQTDEEFDILAELDLDDLDCVNLANDLNENLESLNFKG
jgi:hypothetical protein